MTGEPFDSECEISSGGCDVSGKEGRALRVSYRIPVSMKRKFCPAIAQSGQVTPVLDVRKATLTKLARYSYRAPRTRSLFDERSNLAND